MDESLTTIVWFFLLRDQFFQNYTKTRASLIMYLHLLQMGANTKPSLMSLDGIHIEHPSENGSIRYLIRVGFQNHSRGKSMSQLEHFPL